MNKKKLDTIEERRERVAQDFLADDKPVLAECVRQGCFDWVLRLWEDWHTIEYRRRR